MLLGFLYFLKQNTFLSFLQAELNTILLNNAGL